MDCFQLCNLTRSTSISSVTCWVEGPTVAFHFQCIQTVWQEQVERAYYFSFSFTQLYGGVFSACYFLLWWWWWNFYLWSSSQWLPNPWEVLLSCLSSLGDRCNPLIPHSISGRCVEGTLSLNIQSFADRQSVERSWASEPATSETAQTPS